MNIHNKRKNIEDSIVLSSMSYVEAQSIKEIEDNLKEAITQDKVDAFLERNSEEVKGLNEENLNDLLDKNIQELSQTEDFRINIVKKKFEFYKKFKAEQTEPHSPT